jgi:multidrug efflux system membrane fusion protein
VYVILDNVAHMKTVQPGVTDGDTTAVTGINPGDILANSSFDKLQDNAKVVISSKPIPAGTTGSSAP